MTDGLATERERFIWAAGYFESRGGIYLGTRQNPARVRIMISDRDKERLERFSKIMGSGRIRGVKTGRDKEYSSWQLTISRRDELAYLAGQLTLLTDGNCRTQLLDMTIYMERYPIAQLPA